MSQHERQLLRAHSIESQPSSAVSLSRAASSSQIAPSGLPKDTHEWLEQRFGHDFSGVRIHSDSEAARRTAVLGTRALTEGKDIYFAPTQFQPHTRAGIGLIAHELTHVVQQRQGQFPPGGATTRPAGARLALEAEAERVAESVNSSSIKRVPVQGRAEAGEMQASLLDDMKTRVLGGLEAIADWIMSKAEAASDAVLVGLNELRRSLRGLARVRVTPEVAARFEAIYLEFKNALPGWIPVPSLSFAGTPTQQQTGVLEIPAAVILVFLAFLMVLLYLADPAGRRARERAAQEVIEKIKESLKPKTQPLPEPEPGPKPGPETTGPTIPIPPKEDKPRPSIEKVSDSNIFMDRVEGGPAQRARIDVGYLANPRVTLHVPAVAIAEATRVDPHGTQAARLAGLPGGARIRPDVDGNVEPFRPEFPKILSAKFNEADFRIALRARERSLPLLTAQAAMSSQLRDAQFPKRVAAVGSVITEVP